MPWFKVDDNLAFHHKVVTAGNAALGLWVRAGSWSAQQLTDGFIPAAVAGVLGSKAQAGRLVNAGLWVEVDGGYRFHEWDQRQPSRENVLENRKKEADRKAKGRAAAAEKNAANPTNTQVNGSRPAGTDAGVPGGVTAGVRSTRPDPTRPVPKGGDAPHETNGRPQAIPEPPSKCEKHRDDPTPPPCGQCGDARRAADEWRTNRSRRQRTAPRCTQHPLQAAHNCRVCASERRAATA